MAQRITLVIAAGIAAFIVVFMGALGTYVVLKGPAAANSAVLVAQQNDTPAQLPLPPSTAPNSSVAPQEQQQTQGQSDDSNNSGAENAYAVSADQAISIALNSTPGAALTQQPRLVNFNGAIAYEVLLDKGYVYVDANSGQVLYNAANGTNTQPRFRRRGR